MVTVIGLGFVGLTTALGFAQYGHKVYGIEANPERMKIIKGGKLPFFEPGLDEALTRHLGKHFFPTENLEDAVADSKNLLQPSCFRIDLIRLAAGQCESREAVIILTWSIMFFLTSKAEK